MASRPHACRGGLQQTHHAPVAGAGLGIKLLPRDIPSAQGRRRRCRLALDAGEPICRHLIRDPLMRQPLGPCLVDFQGKPCAGGGHPQPSARRWRVLRLGVPRAKPQLLYAPIWLDQPGMLGGVVGPTSGQVVLPKCAGAMTHITSSAFLIQQANRLRSLGQQQCVRWPHLGLAPRIGQQPLGVSGRQTHPTSGRQSAHHALHAQPGVGTNSPLSAQPLQLAQPSPLLTHLLSPLLGRGPDQAQGVSAIHCGLVEQPFAQGERLRALNQILRN